MKATKEDCIKMQEVCKDYLKVYTANMSDISLFVADKSVFFASEVEAKDMENRLIKARNTRLELLKKKMQEIYGIFYNYISSGTVVTTEELQKMAGIFFAPCDNTDRHPFSMIDTEYQILFGIFQSISRYLVKREMEEKANVKAA